MIQVWELNVQNHTFQTGGRSEDLCVETGGSQKAHTTPLCQLGSTSAGVCALGTVTQWSRETVTCFEGRKQLTAFFNVLVSLGRTRKQKCKKISDAVLVQVPHNLLLLLLSWVCCSIPARHSYRLRLPPIPCPLREPDCRDCCSEQCFWQKAE